MDPLAIEESDDRDDELFSRFGGTLRTVDIVELLLLDLDRVAWWVWTEREEDDCTAADL